MDLRWSGSNFQLSFIIYLTFEFGICLSGHGCDFIELLGSILPGALKPLSRLEVRLQESHQLQSSES